MEDVGRLVRGSDAVRLFGIAVDHGTRVIAPNDCIDTAEETWEEDVMTACRDHTSTQTHTSKRITKKRTRFLRAGQITPRPIAGYIKPEGAKQFADWLKDESATPIISEGLKVLRQTLRGSVVADFFNKRGFSTGIGRRGKTKWDGTMALAYYRNPLLKGMPARGTKHTVRRSAWPSKSTSTWQGRLSSLPCPTCRTTPGSSCASLPNGTLTCGGGAGKARSVALDLDHTASSLNRHIDVLRQSLSRQYLPGRVASASEIAAVAALEAEFEEVDLLKGRRISVVTAPIKLEDVYLGPFESHSGGTGSAMPRPTQSLPRTRPTRKTARTSAIHMSRTSSFVRGEGTATIKAALTSGRLYDFFILVRQVLGTYNPDSAYVTLANWHGNGSCACCDYLLAHDGGSYCERCHDHACEDCSWAVPPVAGPSAPATRPTA
jgi:hypothetical protein